MKIIKRGKNISKVKVCPTCECKFTYLPGDVEQDVKKIYNVPPEFWDVNGGYYSPCGCEYVEYVRCPYCGDTIEVGLR